MLFSEVMLEFIKHDPHSALVDRLTQLLDTPAEITAERDSTGVRPCADFELVAGAHSFIVAWKSSSAAGSVASAISTLQRCLRQGLTSRIPLVVVPYMGAVGRKHCLEADMAWLDLSGNARIIAPGLRIHVEGQPNRFVKRGRPANVFAPKSSRVPRLLLASVGSAFSQREIARATDLGEGFVSRIVRRLEEDELVVRNELGAVQAANPNLLLDAWQERYSFSKHARLQGHLPTRDSVALLHHIAEELESARLPYAATGLAAAWKYQAFATFRIVTLFVAEPPDSETLDRMGFRRTDSGANLWLVAPNDESVFWDEQHRDGVRCASPLQTYLDLSGHPERAAEAAAELRREHLTWETDA
jgi:hypothetical protein